MNLLPCISRICKRDEEAIQETLATAMHKLCPVLMGFTNDNEVKVCISFLSYKFKAFMLSGFNSSHSTYSPTSVQEKSLFDFHILFCCHLVMSDCFLTQLLLKAFLPNIKSSSATCRRTAAASLTLICQECRKPPTFFAWLLNVLLGE